MQAVSPSYTLQHQEPLTATEIDSLTSLFNELVLANKELEAIEQKRGLEREAAMAKEVSAAYKELMVDGNFDFAAGEKVMSLHHQERCNALDREFNTTRQKFLHTTFNVVQYLRTLKEYVAWECDMSFAIRSMQKVNNMLKQAVANGKADPSQVLPSIQHMDEEIKQHQDQSSELFLRTACGIAINAKEELDDGEMNANRLCKQTATKCVQTFEEFQKHLVQMSQKDPVFPEGYNAFVLSLKAFGLAFKNYKNVGSTITGVQCLQPFAPAGMVVAVKVPQVEL